MIKNGAFSQELMDRIALEYKEATSSETLEDLSRTSFESNLTRILAAGALHLCRDSASMVHYSGCMSRAHRGLCSWSSILSS